MRVLFTAPAGLGHLHPLMPLATAMSERGHEVRFASDPASCAAAERAGLTATPAGLSGERRRELIETTFGVNPLAARRREHSDLMVRYGFAGVAAPVMADDLRTLVADWRPDLVVHDALEFAGALIAAELGVRHVTHSFGSTVPEHRLRAADEFVAPLWQQSGLTPPPMCGVFSDVYVDIRPTGLPGHPPEGTCTLVERPAPADALGGELPAIVTEADSRPLVYVTLGTVFADVGLLRSVIDAVAPLDLRVLVTVGPQGDPAAVGVVPDSVAVLRYVPQTQLLGHCDVVVSHAGSGTFLGALAHGVPQLCLPQGADQFANSDGAAATGAGLVLEDDAATGPAIGAAVEELLRSTSYRKVARQLADEIAAMPTADEVARELEALADR